MTDDPRRPHKSLLLATPGKGENLREAKRMINGLLDNARIEYQIRHEALQNLEELNKLLDDPLLVNNKKMVAGICGILVKMLVSENIVKEGSIIHRLALRLLDYILRNGEETAGKNDMKTREGNYD
jgi:hypothetical protein